MTMPALDRIKTLIDAYGADGRHWPQAERQAARMHLDADPAAADRLLFEARQIDAALDASPSPMVSATLRDRVIASAVAAGLTPRTARRFWDRMMLIFGVGWAAAACAGVVAGTSLALHYDADRQLDAVLYQSQMAGIDDIEVLG